MKHIVFANHKGGCAKTTTAMNLAVILASEGHRVLAVDLDPQGNMSVALGADLQKLDTTQVTSLRMMLDRKGEYSEYIIKARQRLDLIPCCLDFDAEAMIDNQFVSRELQLKAKLEPAAYAYDYCVIDTPPALRGLTLNALAISDLTIIPIESSMFALVGITQLLRVIGRVSRAHAQEMIIMALNTMYVPRQNFDKELRNMTIEVFADNVFQETIPRAVSVNQAIAQRKSVFETDPNSQAALAFYKFTKEVEQVLSNEEIGARSYTRKLEQGS